MAFAIAGLISQVNLDYFEGLLYDARVWSRPAPHPTDHIELVFMDSRTVDGKRGVPGLAALYEFLYHILADRPLALVFASDPSELSGTDAEKKRLADFLQDKTNVYHVVEKLEMRGQEGTLRHEYPFEKIDMFPGPKNTDTILFAKDGVTRRMMLTYQDQTLLDPFLARHFNPEIEDLTRVRGLFEFLDSQQVYVDFAPGGTYPRHSFIDVENGSFVPGTFKDKIVFVGEDLGTSSKDYLTTPYSRNVVAMTVPEMHANMVDTLIRNSAPIRAPRWFNLGVIVGICLLTVYVVLQVRPARGLLVIGGTLALFTLVAFFAFWPLGIWIDMAQPFLAIFLCYYFLIPYRLILENRRSWEYYQKNQLLTQVEELKNNFISLMSHDLKTPLARIQGMIDVILRDANPLSQPQKQALMSVHKSSEDLLSFISSILSFGRIESQAVKLHLQSKDVNLILTEVIEKFEDLAREKNISIITEFEPLFSISIDVDLIRQVFANLVENAIKYSHEGSKVLLSTEENTDMVVVQIADQGRGIPADEIPNVFMKFFRSREAKSSTVKGSGLGLYLAKYFVELHRGRISVESAEGQGSTFTVELPIRR